MESEASQGSSRAVKAEVCIPQEVGGTLTGEDGLVVMAGVE